MHDSSFSQLSPIKSGLDESKFCPLMRKAVGTCAILPSTKVFRTETHHSRLRS